MKIKKYYTIFPLKTIWNQLAADYSRDPAQSYSLNRMQYFRIPVLFFLRKYSLVYAVIRDGKEAMIVPLTKKWKSKDYGLFVEGIPGCNLVFSSDMKSERIAEFLRFLKHELGEARIQLMPIKEDSEMKKAVLLMDGVNLQTIEKVNIHVGNQYETYYQSLSKHVRQNIRTSYNRLRSDGLEYALKYTYNARLEKSVAASVLAVYDKRREERYSIYTSRIHRLYLHYFDVSTTIAKEAENNIVFTLYIDNQIAAFMSGMVIEDGKRAVIPRLAINEDFGKYSPGYLLINEAAKVFCNELNIEDLDLLSGTEKYKFDMGGEIYLSYRAIL